MENFQNLREVLIFFKVVIRNLSYENKCIDELGGTTSDLHNFRPPISFNQQIYALTENEYLGIPGRQPRKLR